MSERELHLMSRDELEVHLRETKDRRDSYAQATLDQQSLLKAKDVEIAKLEAENKRLMTQLEATQTSLTILSTDQDSRYDSANEEVQYLRELCIANGVNPNR